MRKGILAGGNWIIDHVKVVDAWPEQDTLVSILEQRSSNGGSPYNILKDLARLGATFPLEAVGLVGDDEDGRVIRADCQAHGIATDQLVVTAAAPTSYTDVMTVKGTGRRTFFHQRGANALLGVPHFDFSRTRTKHFHLGYLLLLDRLDQLDQGRPRAATVLAQARAAGLTTSIDCVSESSERFQSVILPALPEVDVLFANDYETEKLAGRALRRPGGLIDPSAVAQAAQALLAHGVRQWVVVHFPEAVFACGANGESVWQPSVRVPAAAIRGTAGAGDALAAGVLLGYLDGQPMAESLRLGVSAAAQSLTDPTCSEGIRSSADCLAAAVRMGFNSLPV